MGHAETTVLPVASYALRPGSVLPVARYRFRFRMEGELILPEYAGSLLRGQFGAALRRTACMTGAKACTGCPLLRTCPYPAIFDTPAPEVHALQKFSQVPNPYVIEPPPFGTRCVPADHTLEFGLVLVGRALDQLPLIAFALQRAFGRGLGKQRVAGHLEDIVWEKEAGDASVWDPEHGRIAAHDPCLAVPALESAQQAQLRIATPIRLQCQGHPLGAEEVTPRKLLTTIMRRASLLFEMHAGLPGVAGDAPTLARRAEGLVDARQLHWKEWTRFSSRQQAEMTLGGVIGDWTLEGDLGLLAQWLWLGQWLHAGKNATMGMGRYGVSFS
jgi:hypothetical protein